MLLEHRAFGLAFRRYGRLLRWIEGREYAFSDLSGRGAKQGFPHVFFVSVAPVSSAGERRSRLTVEIKGKWTSRWISGSVAQWWLRYVCREHARLLAAAAERELLPQEEA